MLYRFKFHNHADILMLQPLGRRVLEALGRDPQQAHGILTPEQIPAALQALERAACAEEAARAAARVQAEAEGREPPRFEEPGLRQRLFTLVQAMQRSQQDDRPMVW